MKDDNNDSSPKFEIQIHVNIDIQGVPEGTLLEQVPLYLRIGAAFEAFKNLAPEAVGVLIAWPENGRPEIWGNVPPEYAGAVLRSMVDRWDRVVSTSLAGSEDTIQ